MNPHQFQEGYYETDNKSWFNGIDVGDYAFMISGSNIQLWRAKSWEKGGYKLVFEKLVTNIEGRTAKFIAFKYFKLFPALISATTKSLRNIAFVQIPLSQPISVDLLKDTKTYQKSDNFRKIIVFESLDQCDRASEDIQLYYQEGALHIFDAPFMDGDTFRNFRDNTDKIGGGRAKKDKALRILKKINHFPTTFTFDEFNIRNLYEACAVRYENYENPDIDDDEQEPPKDNAINEIKLTMPFNTILYGPPGTGKTYKTLIKALSIVEQALEEDLELESRRVLHRRYHGYRENGQIAFVTFHQSFAYEDFIEGIKPSMENEGLATDNTQLRYEITPGIFKRLCDDAKGMLSTKTVQELGLLDLTEDELASANFYKMSLGDSQNPLDQKIYDYCLTHNCVAMGWGGDVDFSDAKDEDDIRELFRQSGKEIAPYDFGVFAVKCLKFWMKQGDLVLIPKGNFTIRAIGRITGEYFFDSNAEIGYNQFRKVQWVAKDIDLPIQQVYTRRFSMQTIYALYSDQIKMDFLRSLLKKEDAGIKNYVLIIDEINRGNISQIFGELITLIEDNKRLGQQEELLVTLPYSKDQFGVPPNLYIIGTMNTADRSVEALDTALRRRFSFEEIAPDPALLTPSRMIWNLLEDYHAHEWEDEVYAREEDSVLRFLSTKDTHGVKKQMRAYWDTYINNKPQKLFPNDWFGNAGLSAILRTINSRIEKLLDADHQIGHSYFMKVGTMGNLQEVFYRNVIPLLQEYFFGNYGKIGLVLGKGFVRKKVWDIKETAFFADFPDYDNASDFTDREVFEIIRYDESSMEDFEKALQILLNEKA